MIRRCLVFGSLCASLVLGCSDDSPNGPGVDGRAVTALALELPEGIGVTKAGDDSVRILVRGDSLATPVWSPARSHLAFLRKRSPPFGSILRVTDSAGSVVVNSASGMATGTPIRWSPNGQRIVAGTTAGTLAVISPTSGSPTEVDVMATDASFSTDSELVCVAPSGQNPIGTAIAMIKTDGSAYRILADSASGRFILPRSVGPDGRISFIYIGNGGEEVWIMGSDGSQRSRLTPLNGPIIDLIPDPSGTRLLIISGLESSSMLYIVSVASGQVSPVTDAVCAGHVGAACWSPDEKTIAFTRPGGGIALIDDDASDQRVISERGRNPNW